MQALFFTYSSLIFFATCLPLIRKDHWTFRIFEFPRLQKLILAVIALLYPLTAGVESTTVLIYTLLLLVDIVYLSYQVFPFTPFHAKTVKNARKVSCTGSIRLLISNVYQPNERFDKLLQRIRTEDPDVIFLVETDAKWKKALAGIEKEYPYRLCKIQDNTYGLLFYSRLPVENAEIRYLIEEDVPSIKLDLKLESGNTICFYGVHPQPPSPTENPYSTERDAELLMVARECAKDRNCPAIVAGDLNDVAWSYTTERFLKISGLQDPRKGRGIFSTFHAKNLFMRWPLDHIFCSSHFALIKMYRLKNINSDHFPVLVELALTDPSGSRQR